MSHFITIEYPDFLANSMRLNADDFQKEIKVSALMKLFEMGKISSGTAAKVLKISRLQFLEMLSEYKISFLESDDINEDFSNA